jgi:hypothetical protein
LDALESDRPADIVGEWREVKLSPGHIRPAYQRRTLIHALFIRAIRRGEPSTLLGHKANLQRLLDKALGAEIVPTDGPLWLIQADRLMLRVKKLLARRRYVVLEVKGPHPKACLASGCGNLGCGVFRFSP